MRTSIDSYNFRKASVLDIPYIYELVLQGSINGAFTGRHLYPNGYGKLLVQLFGILLKPLRVDGNSAKVQALVLIEYDGEEIGFLHYTQESKTGANTHMHLEHCIVSSLHRGQGHGNRIVCWVVAQASNNKCMLSAVCSKYSRAMQHILKKNRFKRISIGKGLEVYTLSCSQPTICKKTIASMVSAEVN